MLLGPIPSMQYSFIAWCALQRRMANKEEKETNWDGLSAVATT
jgi:membrane protein required for beta-lactamase induction